MIFSSAIRLYEALERMGAAIFRRMDTAYSRVWRSRDPWPVTPGAYVVGDPNAPVAVCTLTSTDLVRPISQMPGVAIAGRVYTSNLGIEKIVTNICANRSIRALLVCGKESPLFRPAQGLCALAAHGIRADKHIVGAEGYLPVLSGIGLDAVEQFRRQVVLIDRTGETDVQQITGEVARLARQFDSGEHVHESRPVVASSGGRSDIDDDRFQVLRPGGKREPLAYDPKGHFVITLQRDDDLIAAHHYSTEMTPLHVMRSRSGEAIILALIREGLVTQLTHAAYLGAEFGKAESALRLGLVYEQDQPLRGADSGTS